MQCRLEFDANLLCDRRPSFHVLNLTPSLIDFWLTNIVSLISILQRKPARKVQQFFCTVKLAYHVQRQLQLPMSCDTSHSHCWKLTMSWRWRDPSSRPISTSWDNCSSSSRVSSPMECSSRPSSTNKHFPPRHNRFSSARHWTLSRPRRRYNRRHFHSPFRPIEIVKIYSIRTSLRLRCRATTTTTPSQIRRVHRLTMRMWRCRQRHQSCSSCRRREARPFDASATIVKTSRNAPHHRAYRRAYRLRRRWRVHRRHSRQTYQSHRNFNESGGCETEKLRFLKLIWWKFYL